MQEAHATFCFLCSVEAEGVLQTLSREQKEARDLLMAVRQLYIQSLHLQRLRCFTERKIVKNLRKAFNKETREMPKVKRALQVLGHTHPWSRESATYHLSVVYPNVQNQWHHAFHTMTLISKRATATALATGDRSDIKLATDMIRFQSTLATQGPFMAQDATALEMDIDIPDLADEADGAVCVPNGVVRVDQASVEQRRRVMHQESHATTRGRVAVDQQRRVGARRRRHHDDDDDDDDDDGGRTGGVEADEASALGVFDTWG